ncbi:MAG: TonB-dependent receptor [Bacteroidales bacterium]|nr:TonB-dependent receptor [Bacteroidales bacterium]
MKRLLAAALATFLTLGLGAQKRTATISGYITDESSGETLIGAGAMVESGQAKGTGAVTNVYGYYTLTVPKGRSTFLFSYLGYEQQTRDINLQRDTTINIILRPSATLEAATVVSQKDAGIQSTYLGAIDIPLVHIQATPVLFGEADVLKAIQMLPGVQGGNEGFTGLYVRGGGPDENLVLLDGIPIYNVDHMLGILSVFQTEAVKKVTLYKGSFPARYSGRVSSIVDIRTNDGNMKKTSGSVGIGVLTDKLHVEGPIIQDKLSYSVSARGLHSLMYDPLIRLYGKYGIKGFIDDDGDYSAYGNYFFYDLNGKLCWRLSDNDRFFLAAYSGKDRLGADFSEEWEQGANLTRTDMSIGWGNNVASLRWNHIFSQKLFANTTVAFNRYNMSMGMGAKVREYDSTNPYILDFDFKYNSGIQDWSGKLDFDYVPSPRHLIKFGSEYTYHSFFPRTSTGIIQETADGETKKEDINLGKDRNYYGHELTLYAEDDMSITDRLTFNPGLNASFFYTDGRPYLELQPRLSAKYSFDKGVTLKTGYARMAQYVHLLSSTQISLPMDLWVPITANIKPVTSDQVSAGIYYDGYKGWEFSIEGYYKYMQNILEYKDGASVIVSDTSWEDKVEMGIGRAYGLELFVQKTAGDITGWISYTLAKSERRFPGGTISLGQWYPYKYDRRHSFNINLNYKINDHLDANAAWVFASGPTTTIPYRTTGTMGPDDDWVMNTSFVTQRNNFRLPSSHHLNVGLTHHKKKKHGERAFTLSIYNVYNRMNPNLVFVNYTTRYDEQAKEYRDKIQLEKVTILPFLPSLNWTYNF